MVSDRVSDIKDSITLKLNDLATNMANEGKKIYNLTAGQLPFRPHPDFILQIGQELKFLKSFHYGPVAGFKALRKKIIKYTEKGREISFAQVGVDADCIISNGTKQSLFNIIGSLINPGDEVILLAPYWVSYPEMIKLWGGVPVVVPGRNYQGFIPDVNELEKLINKKTKAIILNSPNNPTGVNYPIQWMEDFADILTKYESISIISDEIYFNLCYFDPSPTYFYQYRPELLARTIIVDGISKSFACTGLRIGYLVGDKKILDGVSRIQAQTTSGPSSLIQNALIQFEFESLDEYLTPIRDHLRTNANIIRNQFREKGLEAVWYQTTSAFFFMIDFSQTPIFQKFKEKFPNIQDYSVVICDDLLRKIGVALVPGTDFGSINSARMSLVLDKNLFLQSMQHLTSYLATK